MAMHMSWSDSLRAAFATCCPSSTRPYNHAHQDVSNPDLAALLTSGSQSDLDDAVSLHSNFRPHTRRRPNKAFKVCGLENLFGKRLQLEGEENQLEPEQPASPRIRTLSTSTDTSTDTARTKATTRLGGGRYDPDPEALTAEEVARKAEKRARKEKRRKERHERKQLEALMQSEGLEGAIGGGFEHSHHAPYSPFAPKFSQPHSPVSDSAYGSQYKPSPPNQDDGDRDEADLDGAMYLNNAGLSFNDGNGSRSRSSATSSLTGTGTSSSYGHRSSPRGQLQAQPPMALPPPRVSKHRSRSSISTGTSSGSRVSNLQSPKTSIPKPKRQNTSQGTRSSVVSEPVDAEFDGVHGGLVGPLHIAEEEFDGIPGGL